MFTDDYRWNANRHAILLSDESVVQCVSDSVPYGRVRNQFLNEFNTPDNLYNATLDYSDLGFGLTKIYAGPQSGKQWMIKKMVVTIGSTVGPTAITNGVRIFTEQDGVEVTDWLAGWTVKSRLDYSMFASRVIDLSVSDKKFDNLTAHLVFNDIGVPILQDNQRVVVSFNDDLSYLDKHYYMVSYVEV